MNKEILTLDQIEAIVRPIALKYQVEAVYLFGSYARGEASEDSDLDFLVFGGKSFKKTLILHWLRSYVKLSTNQLMYMKYMR
ncbi:MAG: nucleotidyltransferase family protein [Anaerovoracaceae bacterium]